MGPKTTKVYETLRERLASGDKLLSERARRFRLDHRADQRKMPAMWSPAR